MGGDVFRAHLERLLRIGAFSPIYSSLSRVLASKPSLAVCKSLRKDSQVFALQFSPLTDGSQSLSAFCACSCPPAKGFGDKWFSKFSKSSLEGDFWDTLSICLFFSNTEVFSVTWDWWSWRLSTEQLPPLSGWLSSFSLSVAHVKFSPLEPGSHLACLDVWSRDLREVPVIFGVFWEHGLDAPGSQSDFPACMWEAEQLVFVELSQSGELQRGSGLTASWGISVLRGLVHNFEPGSSSFLGVLLGASDNGSDCTWISFVRICLRALTGDADFERDLKERLGVWTSVKHLSWLAEGEEEAVGFESVGGHTEALSPVNPSRFGVCKTGSLKGGESVAAQQSSRVTCSKWTLLLSADADGDLTLCAEWEKYFPKHLATVCLAAGLLPGVFSSFCGVLWTMRGDLLGLLAEFSGFWANLWGAFLGVCRGKIIN